jgi:hypothetical protein
MSHLSILPTVLRDPELLAGSLVQLGFTPRFGGQLEGFAADAQPVLLQVELPEGGHLGWQRQADGSLALVGDLQRISRSRCLQRLLTRLSRAYAARDALQQAAGLFSPGTVSLTA